MKLRFRVIIGILLAFVLISVAVALNWGRIERLLLGPTESSIKTGLSNGDDQVMQKNLIKHVAEELTVPWGVAFLPGGDLLVTERNGVLRRVGQEGKIFRVEGVQHVGEGGLLGIALHPQFKSNGWLYLYSTTRSNGELVNRVERYTYSPDTLLTPVTIIDSIPGSTNHDGGRIAFGPDGLLYITTGDASNEQYAQDTTSLAGKILRVSDEGAIPPDNPFGNAVYSYGHRNPQGLAWDDDGRLWSTEHGRSGVRSGYDELNLITKGGNYGWPLIEGDGEQEGMIVPVVHSGSDETWAPASLAFSNGSLFFSGLRGQSLYEVRLKGVEVVELKAHFRNEYGRLREVAVDTEGNVYFTTSNTDGRGTRNENDDKLVRVQHKLFFDAR